MLVKLFKTVNKAGPISHLKSLNQSIDDLENHWIKENQQRSKLNYKKLNWYTFSESNNS